jgi:hypothetical protein
LVHWILAKQGCEELWVLAPGGTTENSPPVHWRDAPGQIQLSPVGTRERPAQHIDKYKEGRRSPSVTCGDSARRDRMISMATAKRKKVSAPPTSIRGKSATNRLLDTMRGVIDEGARGMTPKDLEESERKFNAALDRAVASRKRRRETA